MSLAHKSLSLLMPWCGSLRRAVNKCGASFATHLWIECMARNAALPSAARGVLFVLKTPFLLKKIQKHEILPYKKLLFSLSVQNEDIPYKNFWFRNFFVRNSLFLGFLHQTGELRKHSHAREQERPGVGTCAPIPVLFVTRGVINKFSQLSPGSLRYAGRNQQIQSIKPRQSTLRGA